MCCNKVEYDGKNITSHSVFPLRYFVLPYYTWVKEKKENNNLWVLDKLSWELNSIYSNAERVQVQLNMGNSMSSFVSFSVGY